MVKQTPKKPTGVKSRQAVPAWALKFGVSTLVTGAVIWLSVLASPQESKVTVLNDASFHKFLAQHKDGALVEFSKKGCTFCNKLSPAYEAAARRAADDDGPAFAILDSEAAPKVVEALGIDKYPMVYWFWGGEKTMELERAAMKTADEIFDFVKWAQSPALQLLDTRAEMEEGLPIFRQSLAKDHKIIVAYNRTDSPLVHDVFEYAAQKHRASHILFLFVREAATDGQLAAAYGQNESLDVELSEWKGREDALSWIKIQVDEIALKGLERKIETNKAKLEELKREEEEKANATAEL
jgi:hypothetical protein